MRKKKDKILSSDKELSTGSLTALGLADLEVIDTKVQNLGYLYAHFILIDSESL